MSSTYYLATAIAFAYLVPSPSTADECTPPTTKNITQSLKEAISRTACKADDKALSNSAMIEGVPFGDQIKQNTQQCEADNGNLEYWHHYLETYLATPDSLLAAECGFRLCQLQKSQRDPDVTTRAIHVLSQVCGASRRLGGNSPFELLDPRKELVIAKSTVSRTNGFSTSDVAVFLDYHGVPFDLKEAMVQSNNGGNVSLMRRHVVTGLNKLSLRVTWPTTLEQNYRPFDIDYRLEAQSDTNGVDGAVRVVPLWGEHCTESTTGECLTCEFTPLTMQIQSVANKATGFECKCFGMKPGKNVTLTVSGHVRPEGSGDLNFVNGNVGYAFLLEDKEKPIQHTVQYEKPPYDTNLTLSATVPRAPGQPVTARISVNDINIWLVKLYPLILDDDFKMKISTK
jgi:hypothetical protein